MYADVWLIDIIYAIFTKEKYNSEIFQKTKAPLLNPDI